MNTQKTAAELRESAAHEDQLAADSFERSDTDGFLTQWAHGITADRDRLQANIVENGGVWRLLALFDAETLEYVPAYRGKSTYGPYFRPIGTSVFISVGRRGASKRKQHQLVEKWAEFPAEAFIDGSGHGLSGRAWVSVRKTVHDSVPPMRVLDDVPNDS